MALLDNTQAQTDTFAYWPYGEERTRTGTTPTPFRFVGALGYYLLTTANVFDAQNVLDLYEKHLTKSPIKPSQRTANPISAELEETILRCLEKEPNLRPQSVGELRVLLLTSPRASDWGPEARAAWWAKYQDQEIQRPGGSDPNASFPIDATVKIDFASRVQ